jgi:hypothetical protein
MLLTGSWVQTRYSRSARSSTHFTQLHYCVHSSMPLALSWTKWTQSTSSLHISLRFIFIASGVGLSPLYCGYFWPIVPTPGDRWGWLWRNLWNEDWQGKPKYSEKTCPSATSSTTNPTWPDFFKIFLHSILRSTPRSRRVESSRIWSTKMLQSRHLSTHTQFLYTLLHCTSRMKRSCILHFTSFTFSESVGKPVIRDGSWKITDY